MCNGNKIRPNIWKHLMGIFEETHLSINQSKRAIISQIYRWHVFQDFTEESIALTKRLVEKGYNENEIHEQISKTFTIERTHLLNQKSQPTSKIISLILRYNRTLPDIKRAVNKHWDILKINGYFEQFFTEPSIIAFIRIGNVQDILGTKTVISNRKQVCQNIDHNNYSKPWNSKLNSLCCTPVQSRNTFRSTVTHKSFEI